MLGVIGTWGKGVSAEWVSWEDREPWIALRVFSVKPRNAWKDMKQFREVVKYFA